MKTGKLTCSICDGKGRLSGHECPICNGKGYTERIIYGKPVDPTWDKLKLSDKPNF